MDGFDAPVVELPVPMLRAVPAKGLGVRVVPGAVGQGLVDHEAAGAEVHDHWSLFEVTRIVNHAGQAAQGLGIADRIREDRAVFNSEHQECSFQYEVFHDFFSFLVKCWLPNFDDFMYFDL
ncbi:MAG: hypothetical protein A2Y67_02900 [Candidatus Buchananbacteria bacterium RBG_13_39_9]|uniref:Uncharacterized protein n=1 Tax=Candidatus Buchananbacteria bacterium RBG_13_39_9 TaxID=1797531 RepID=A0A1G1XPM7_9BACT|nr:MAG: hypothetical protein A2Y67_02900 [Candidatus Buchananbacteria bacterium RBG_13_39_9]